MTLILLALLGCNPFSTPAPSELVSSEVVDVAPTATEEPGPINKVVTNASDVNDANSPLGQLQSAFVPEFTRLANKAAAIDDPENDAATITLLSTDFTNLVHGEQTDRESVKKVETTTVSFFGSPRQDHKHEHYRVTYTPKTLFINVDVKPSPQEACELLGMLLLMNDDQIRGMNAAEQERKRLAFVARLLKLSKLPDP